MFKTESTTTASYQIVSDCHGAVDFSYAWNLEDAKKQADEMRKMHGNAEIRTRGEFVPHYPREQ